MISSLPSSPADCSFLIPSYIEILELLQNRNLRPGVISEALSGSDRLLLQASHGGAGREGDEEWTGLSGGDLGGVLFSPVACPIAQVLEGSGETAFCAKEPQGSATLYLKTPKLGHFISQL